VAIHEDVMNRPRSDETSRVMLSIGMRLLLIAASTVGLAAALLLSAGDARA
jgi:hypothetical protein